MPSLPAVEVNTSIQLVVEHSQPVPYYGWCASVYREFISNRRTTVPNKSLGAILNSLPAHAGCGDGVGREAHRHGEDPDRSAPYIFGV